MSELEQTIEELEAEVLAELEEVDAEEISEAPEKVKSNKIKSLARLWISAVSCKVWNS